MAITLFYQGSGQCSMPKLEKLCTWPIRALDCTMKLAVHCGCSAGEHPTECPANSDVCQMGEEAMFGTNFCSGWIWARLKLFAQHIHPSLFFSRLFFLFFPSMLPYNVLLPDFYIWIVPPCSRQLGFTPLLFMLMEVGDLWEIVMPLISQSCTWGMKCY